MFGGRGATLTRHTTASLKGLSRNALLKLAEPIFLRRNAALGRTEAQTRFRALTTGRGNSDAQLRKYILRNQ